MNQSPAIADRYDWVVIGDHPGALLSAALASKLGLSVLVLQAAPSARVQISKAGHCLDPETNYWLAAAGLDQSQTSRYLLAECLIQAGLESGERDLFRRSRIQPVVTTPEVRITLTQENESFLEEIERELGQETEKKLGWVPLLKQAEAALVNHWRSLPERLTLVSHAGAERESEIKGKRGARSKSKAGIRASTGALGGFALKKTTARPGGQSGKRASEYSSQLGLPEIKSLFRGIRYAVTGCDEQDPKVSDVIDSLALARGACTYIGGGTAYRELLLRLARRSGAHVPSQLECRRIFVENGRLTGVQVSSHGNLISTVGGVIGCGLPHSENLISASGRGRLKKFADGPRPVGWRFTIALTVNQEGVLPGLGLRTIWQERGAPPIELEVVDPADYGIRQKGQALIFARTVLPFSQETLESKSLAMTAARLLRRVFEVVPFLDFHLVRVYPDFREGGEELAEAYGFSVPELIPENLLVYEPGTGLGCESGIERLFVVSGESYPELGTLGPTVADVESVGWLAHKSGLPGPFA